MSEQMDRSGTGSGAACARVRGRAIELLDGGLPELEAARDEGHLEACAACRAELDRWEALLEAGRLAGPASAEDLERARAGLDERLARTRPSALRALAAAIPPRARHAAAAAAAALLVLGLLGQSEVLEQPVDGVLRAGTFRPDASMLEPERLSSGFRAILGEGGE